MRTSVNPDCDMKSPKAALLSYQTLNFVESSLVAAVVSRSTSDLALLSEARLCTLTSAAEYLARGNHMGGRGKLASASIATVHVGRAARAAFESIYAAVKSHGLCIYETRIWTFMLRAFIPIYYLACSTCSQAASTHYNTDLEVEVTQRRSRSSYETAWRLAAYCPW